MEPFSRDTEESTEDITGRKNSKIKSLKTRLFRRGKKADAEANVKLSQSASDIAAGKGLGSDEDLVSTQGMMGSRALSHDSIFLDDQVLTEAEPARVLSQENVHSKIKALQTKLQLQKMHFGPPPMVLPIKSPEEPSSHLEDFTFHSSNDASGEETLTKAPSPTSFSSVSPIAKSAPTKSQPSLPFSPFSAPSRSSTSTSEPPLDFSKPAEFTASLDTSAARHRMSIKPRNQRASTKMKTSPVSPSGSPLHNLKNTDLLKFGEEEEQQPVAQEEAADTEKEKADISQHPPLKPAEVSPVRSEAAPKLSSQSFGQQHQEITASQVLRYKPHRRVNTAPAKRPHSSFIESEIREKRDAGLEAQAMSDSKMEVCPEQLSPFSSVVTSRFSSAQQQLHGEEDNSRWIKRPLGSGSIRPFENQDGDRPRSGSFGGRLELTDDRNKTTGGTKEKEKEKEEPKSSLLKGNPFVAERLRQDGSPSRGPGVPWERKTTLKKAESTAQAKNTLPDTAAVEVEEVETCQEVVGEAGEEGKTPFGIKLRSTSLSLKYRSENAFNRQSKTELSDDQEDKKKRQETDDSTNRIPEKLPTNTSCALRPKDPAPSGIALQSKQNTSPTDSPPSVLTEVQTSSSNNKEAETTPQTSSSDVSWMALAMEKTRSLQQLFTSRFPRDFTGMQAASRPQAQTQPKAETVSGTQPVKVPQSANQPSADTLKESVQSRSQENVVKPSAVAFQQKNVMMKSQMSKQPNEAQPVSHSTPQPVIQPVPWTTQSPVRSSSQAAAATSQPLAQSNLSSGQQQQQQQQQSPWTSRGLQPGTQVKSITSALTSESPVTSAAVPASDSALEKEEREATVQKDSPSLCSRRTIWTGSVADRAAFLEKRAEWTTPPSLRGAEQRKAQTEAPTSGDAPTLVKSQALNKETMEEIRQVLKSAESSPIRGPEKPHEDKWLRKNIESSSSPSLLHTRPSVLQSVSDSSQPSWMELAKRKSMAWSDKTMD